MKDVPYNPTSAEREAEILKDVIRALLPDRHAVGRIAGEFTRRDDGSLGFNIVVTVPLDRSSDESSSRELAAALMPELRSIGETYERALSKVAEEMRNGPVLEWIGNRASLLDCWELSIGERPEGAYWFVSLGGSVVGDGDCETAEAAKRDAQRALRSYGVAFRVTHEAES